MSRQADAPVPIAELVGCACQRLRKATRRVTQIYESFLAPVGLTSPQFGLLANLHARDDVSMNELARRLVTDATTLNRNLKPLAKAGYVSVGAGSDDRRERRIRITPAGRRVLERAVPLWREAQQHLETELGAAAFKSLNEALARALDKLA
jgi:DNA-binding MarR family transcriptional regulator